MRSFGSNGLRGAAAIAMAAALAVLLSGVDARAQEPTGRVGVDESNPVRLRLAEAIEMALQRNREIEVERINTQQAGYDVDAARGVYDPVLHMSSYVDHRINPVASALGGGADGSVTTTTIASDATLRKAFSSGGYFEVGAQQTRTDTDNVFSSINPQDQTGLTLSFRQPLLRGLGMDENRRRLKVARLRLDQTDAQFRQRVVETVGAVQRGYWDLEFAIKNVEVARDAVSLAEAQRARLKRLVDEGINAPVELVQIDAELARRRENVYRALESVTLAENALKALILADRTDGVWDQAIVPIDVAAVTPVTLTIDDAVASAVANRPELASLAVQEQINEVDVRFFKDQTKPQLDLFGSYGLTGLAGTPVTGPNPFSGNSEVLRQRINEISVQLGLQPLPAPPVQTVPSVLVGGFGQSLQTLLSNDYRAYRVGVELSWPVGSRTARANLGRAEAEGRKIVAQRQSLEQRVEREVRNSLQSVQTARQRVDAARASREAAQIQLNSEQRRYEAGLSTTYFVLERQNELADARARELQALTDYNKAVAELQRVVGTTLAVNSIDVGEVKEATTE
jgi:outer membrane protein TolC